MKLMDKDSVSLEVLRDLGASQVGTEDGVVMTMAVKAAQKDKEPYIELSVRLTNGAFNARLEFNPKAPKEERDAFVLSWLQLIERAAALCRKGERA